jgi:(p)ppGpp synthase/HD superfamily hydrolase
MKSNQWNPDLFMDLWHFATQKHGSQTYGGSLQDERIVYMNHVGAVVMEVSNCLMQTAVSYNANLAIGCAVLHDTIEDTSTTYNEISQLFGTEIADGVLALTKNVALAKKLQMQDSLARIQQQPCEVAMVKLADRICNLYKPPFYWDKSKAEAYRLEAEVILTELGCADVYLAHRLKERIERYKMYTQ